MIYLVASEDHHILILEPGNLEQLKKGKFVHSPDRTVLLAYTPDPIWLAEKLKQVGLENLSPEIMDSFIKDSQKRPVVMDQARHPYEIIVREDKKEAGLDS